MKCTQNNNWNMCPFICGTELLVQIKRGERRKPIIKQKQRGVDPTYGFLVLKRFQATVESGYLVGVFQAEVPTLWRQHLQKEATVARIRFTLGAEWLR
jgi:hypothetical protein